MVLLFNLFNMVRHFGVFKFKPSVSDEQIENCFQTMMAMVGTIPGLMKMEYGPYNGKEGLNDGSTHGDVRPFADTKVRDNYLPHPVHEEVKKVVVPCLERYIVFDINVES